MIRTQIKAWFRLLSASLVTMITLGTSSFAVATETSGGLENRFVLSDTASIEQLSDSTSSYISADGQRLFIGRSGDTQRLTSYTLDETGALQFEQVLSTGDPGFANLPPILDLTGSPDAGLLYALGETGLAILSVSPTTGSISLLEQLPLTSAQTLALTPQGNRLLVGSSSTNEGARLALYTLDGNGRTPTLADEWLYPMDMDVGDIEIGVDGTSAYVSTNTSIFEHSLGSSNTIGMPIATPLGLTSEIAPRLSISNDERNLYATGSGLPLLSFARSAAGMTFMQTQRLPSVDPTVVEGNLFTPRELQLSRDESTVFVARESFLFSAQQIVSLVCLDSYNRDPATGLIRLAGFSCAGESGSLLSIHPQLDLAYSTRASISQIFGSPTVGRIGVFASLPPLPETSLVSAVLPTARTKGNNTSQVDDASAFATVINIGSANAEVCQLRTVGPSADIASISYQRVNPATNLPLPESGVNEEFEIPAGESATLTFTVSERINEVESVLLDIQAVCLNATAAPSVEGINTLLFSTSSAPLADLVSVTATLSRPGVVQLPGNSGLSLFTAAAINIGNSDTITAVPVLELGPLVDGLDPFDGLPDLNLEICETNIETAECLVERSASTSRTMATDDIATYTVFVTGRGESVPFFPERNRVFIVFLDQNNRVRGASSVAVETVATP